MQHLFRISQKLKPVSSVDEYAPKLSNLLTTIQHAPAPPDEVSANSVEHLLPYIDELRSYWEQVNARHLELEALRADPRLSTLHEETVKLARCMLKLLNYQGSSLVALTQGNFNEQRRQDHELEQWSQVLNSILWKLDAAFKELRVTQPTLLASLRLPSAVLSEFGLYEATDSAGTQVSGTERSVGKQRELDQLLQQVGNTHDLPAFRNIDKYVSPTARRVMKACDRIEQLAAQGRIDTADIQHLLATAASGNVHVEGSIARSIANMGAPAIPFVIQQLDNQDDGIRLVASTAAGLIGTAALPYLEQATHELTGNGRNAALSSIVRVGTPGLPVLQRLLNSGDSDVRKNTAITLAIWNRQTPEPTADLHDGAQLLLHELKSQDMETSEFAAYGLGICGGRALQNAMLELPVSGISQSDLGEPEGKHELPRLILLLQDGDPDVRQRAAIYSAQQGETGVTPFLLKSLQDESTAVARAAKFWAIWKLTHLPQS